ncbi:MAG: preprotein translocase subunit SecY [Candidatus Jacksonbacteria bacterium]|jgi:preprotein translocase subunit SecY|nr:preprotein translocase subunit SecY [Candidatus Jacksonbacteria bacterium]MBT6034088.1 preprotein translocase subunit SecY [Candidatus Jacksonbacteria bacterium]MBT6301123.1 preprotein translocase subunit SecY [Candidatus Jacksonbacteria bacterium]MBT6757294.1 preprotein translocase subunit SecY [Candidatus Jacksonbacteria bacterium]MBT6955625.1 preprotein translocase subunit SecY [Candidatus Jacksonbacteria bacterium]
MAFRSGLKQFFKTKSLRNDLIFVLLMLVVFRFMAHIPVPGVDPTALQSSLQSNQVLGLLNLLTGGGLENFSIIMLGVGPYITASIIFQLLTMIVPQLEELSKDGERGQKIISKWTRWATVPLAALQGYSTIIFLSRLGGGAASHTGAAGSFLSQFTPLTWAATLATVTAGTILLMWIGEIISERSLGNGLSLIIFAGIIAGLPQALFQAWLDLSNNPSNLTNYLLLLLVVVLVVAGVVFITEGQRNIPIAHARQVRGARLTSGAQNYLPLRVNMAGVIPIIFAISVVLFPPFIAQFFVRAESVWVSNAAAWVVDIFQGGLSYGIIYFVLVVAFTFFYTAIIFHPKQIAENLQKQSSFIPGIRPGKETEVYLQSVVNRILLAGALFLGAIAVLPLVLQSATSFNLIIGGTSLLIVVSVVIESIKKVEAQLTYHSYE